MSESTIPELPTWVSKRDGRLAPFEPDKICQALFAATETLGQPSAFLARELTDGVLHFLASEYGGTMPTTAQIAELAVKVVRALGHPDLALAFAQGDAGQEKRRAGSTWPGPAPEAVLAFSPRQAPELVVRQCLREYSRQAVFSRDLVAAQKDGLLILGDLEGPLHLNSCLFSGCPGPAKLLHDLLPIHRLARGIVVDGPEYALGSAQAAREWAQELLAGLEALDLWAVVNLNCTRPPPWAADSSAGPLFAGPAPLFAPGERAAILQTLLETLLSAANGRAWVDWHVAEDADGETASPLPGLQRRAAPQLRFVFDRPRRPIALAEGIDRQHPAVLQTVGVHLPRLVEFLDVRGEPQRLFRKLPSLARMLISVGVQKRRFLRERGGPELARGFLLDRARLLVVPVGLEEAVRALVGQGICAGAQGQELACQLLASLLAHPGSAGQTANLDVVVDGALGAWASPLGPADPPLAAVAGVTTWDPGAPVKTQLQAAGLLHAAAAAGTATVLLSADQAASPRELADWLRFACKRTELVRLRWLVSAAFRQHELALSPG